MNSSIDDAVASTERKKKINDLAKSIKKKYLALKLGKSEEDESLKKLFDPLATPLKQLAATSDSLNKKIDKFHHINIKKKTKRKEEEEEKLKRSKLEQTQFLPLEDITSTRINVDDEDGDDNDEDGDDDGAYGEKSQLQDITSEAITEYLDQYPIMSQKYVTEHWTNHDTIDKKYGPVYDSSTSSWLLGRKRIDFDRRTGNIIIDGHQFKGTPGLYQLIFYHDPSFNDNDKKAYKSILEMTGAHKDALGRMKGSNIFKYREIIRPLFSKPSHQSFGASSSSGRGLSFDSRLIYNNKPMEYIYWDDPNELVDRLRLLIASKDAGNTSHDNEIVAIVNELKESNLIY